MNEDALIFQQFTEQLEEEADEEYWEMGAASLGVIVGGAEISRQLLKSRETRQYLTRPELLENPRIATPWTSLYDSRSDRAYITTMGFDVATFDFILESGFVQTWLSTPIPQTDTSRSGDPQPGGRSLDPPGALGLVLHYLSSTMLNVSLQQIFALIPATVVRYLDFSLDILLEVLRRMPDARIKWLKGGPGGGKFQEYNDLIIVRHPRLIGAFTAIDGLNLPVQTLEDEDIENATYNRWLSEHFVSSVLVFSPKGKNINAIVTSFTDNILGEIIDAVVNAPGSWHDANVARPIFERLRTRTPPGYYLIADTAFPRGTQSIAGRICTPLKAGQAVRGTPDEIAERMAYDRELLSYRQTAEWGNRGLQGAFGCLRVPLPIDNAERQGNLLEICNRLNNLRTRRVGINQIRTVYMRYWQDTAEDIDIWQNFENMLFSDQRKNNRVACFHTYAEYT
ncbi:unnamed protein product [Cyclocybe aegerita]|uniref:DDE Tnp4 domain-containing protein n=1 Tax=Cyclocybe aegerita TaxID=1973307 RepID=A0A8S0X7Z0_CYCAE|nr:unnamed protein product [Cyclocybe aegerita]